MDQPHLISKNFVGFFSGHVLCICLFLRIIEVHYGVPVGLVVRYDVLGKGVGPVGLLPLHSTSLELTICITLHPDLKLDEPNVQFNHLNEKFDMVMSNLAFKNISNGVILYPCFTIPTYTPSNVVSCIF